LRPDRLYLTDMEEAAGAIGRFVGPVDESEFLGDEILQSAVLQKLIVFGEAAARVSGDIKERYSHLEWKDIVAFRNIAVHAYFSIDWSIVWKTAIEEIPTLQSEVRLILATEFPPEVGDI